MTTRLFSRGLILLSLIAFAGCASAPPSPAPTLIVNGCATPSRCTLPASNPSTDGELNLALEQTEMAWASCAAKVDAIISCHAEADTHE